MWATQVAEATEGRPWLRGSWYRDLRTDWLPSYGRPGPPGGALLPVMATGRPTGGIHDPGFPPCWTRFVFDVFVLGWVGFVGLRGGSGDQSSICLGHPRVECVSPTTPTDATGYTRWSLDLAPGVCFVWLAAGGFGWGGGVVVCVAALVCLLLVLALVSSVD